MSLSNKINPKNLILQQFIEIDGIVTQEYDIFLHNNIEYVGKIHLPDCMKMFDMRDIYIKISVVECVSNTQLNDLIRCPDYFYNLNTDFNMSDYFSICIASTIVEYPIYKGVETFHICVDYYLVDKKICHF